MANPKLEEVFKKSGIPTYTLVKPTEYSRLLVSLRTPGRGVVVEGPSGIGKTTRVLTALQELGISDRAKELPPQIDEITQGLLKKLAEVRTAEI